MPEVKIVNFPETPIAALEHRGPPVTEHQSVLKFVAWRKANGLAPPQHRSYGIHYNDPFSVAPEDYRVDMATNFDGEVASNDYGVVNKTIPACRCAVARHHGSRQNVTTAAWLALEWLPASGEEPGSFPLFFHYINVGPDVREEEMLTDVYLPLADNPG